MLHGLEDQERALSNSKAFNPEATLTGLRAEGGLRPASYSQNEGWRLCPTRLEASRILPTVPERSCTDLI